MFLARAATLALPGDCEAIPSWGIFGEGSRIMALKVEACSRTLPPRYSPTRILTCFCFFSKKYCKNCPVQDKDRSLNAYVTPCQSSKTFSPSFNLDRCTTFLCLNLLKALSISSRGKMVKWPVKLDECFPDPWFPTSVHFMLLGTFLHSQRLSVAGAVTDTRQVICGY